MLSRQYPSNIRLLKKCPVCTTDYQQSMVQVLDESEFGLLTYASCNLCGANLLTRFSSLPQGIIGNAILTDLKPEEVMSFVQASSISADHVLIIQQEINKNLINKFRQDGDK